MADFIPPPGPPPPKVPEGWKALWNEQYKEWFYVNTFTKQSQWEKPTEAVNGTSAHAGELPPGYDHSTAQPTQPEKSGLASNNPYNQSGSGQNHNMSEDEKLARKLQAEESQRAGVEAGGVGSTDRGAADSYYTGAGNTHNAPYVQSPSASPTPYGQQDLPPRGGSKSKGLFSKLQAKLGGGSSSRPYQQGNYGYPQQYPPQQYQAGYPPQQYGGYPPQQHYGGYPQQYGGYASQHGGRRPGGGMGPGGMMLGAGAGLLGGAMLMNAIDGSNEDHYEQGFEDGMDAGDGGGDF